MHRPLVLKVKLDMKFREPRSHNAGRVYSHNGSRKGLRGS